MATTQIEFISVNPGGVLQASNDDRRRVRIQVMRDFRRKEREREGEECTAVSLAHNEIPS